MRRFTLCIAILFFWAACFVGAASLQNVNTGFRNIDNSDSVAVNVSGTTNQVSVTDNGDGTITLSTPQNTHTGATPTFASQTLGNNDDADPSLTFDGDTSNGVINYDEDNSEFEFDKDVTVSGTVAATTVTGANVTSGADPGHTHTGTGAVAPTSHTLTLSGFTGAESKTGSITGVSSSDPAITFIEAYISNDPTGDENIIFTLGFYRTDSFNVTDLIIEYTFNITYTETNGGVGDGHTTDVVDTTSGLTKGDWILWQEDSEYARLTAVPTATGIAFMEAADGAKADDTGLVRVTRITNSVAKYEDGDETNEIHVRGTTESAPNASMNVLVTVKVQ